MSDINISVSQKLPVTLYESVIDIVAGEATMLFVPLTYTLATEEAERIGVDHVVRMSTSDVGEKSVGKLQKCSFQYILLLCKKVKAYNSQKLLVLVVIGQSKFIYLLIVNVSG